MNRQEKKNQKRARGFLLVASLLLMLALGLWWKGQPHSGNVSRVIDTVSSVAAQDAMVLVPAGVFKMGTNDRDGLHNLGDSSPQHQVPLEAFYIDKTEVTNVAYKQYCTATGYAPPPQWRNGTYPPGEENVPVTYVNLWEALAYARWQGKRLPTEVEWEKAARGTDGRRYPWGNEWNPQLLVWAAQTPQSVGSKPAGASPYGALDMAGNVWEWTTSWYDSYASSSLKNPKLRKQYGFGQLYKVVRGGVFGNFHGREFDAATYHRAISRPQTRSEWIGFRCVKSVS